MSDSEQEQEAPKVKVRAPNRHRFKTIGQRIDEVRESSEMCFGVAGSLMAAAAELLLLLSGSMAAATSVLNSSSINHLLLLLTQPQHDCIQYLNDRRAERVCNVHKLVFSALQLMRMATLLHAA
jgi:hypothetical protein